MHYLFVLAFALLTMAISSLAHAKNRVALVIGNSKYQHTAELRNPGNDAADIAASLKKLGFKVMVGLDLDKLAMDRIIQAFAESLSGASLGAFFYAGHGLQVGGQNYLVPVDAKLNTAAALDFEMTRLDVVQRAMERATNTNVLFLDACRDNPLSRNLARALGTRSTDVGRGLAVVEAGSGTLISFSTQPGATALDGEGRNSPFSGALAKRIEAPEDLMSILIGVRKEVVTVTHHKQVPWEHSALLTRLQFAEPPPAVSERQLVKDYDKEMELALWNAVKDGRTAAILQTYLDRFPNGTFAGYARVVIEQINKERETLASLAQREEEARRAEEVKAATEARQADDLRKAEEAAVTAREAVRKAQDALKTAEAERQAALNAAEEARRSAEATKTATAVPNPAVPSPAPTVSTDPSALARALQTELKRVGCHPGAVDGQWGAKARDALGRFARMTKADLPADKPTEAALRAVAGQDARICSAVCRSSETEVDGRCVAKARPDLRPEPSAPKVAEQPTKAKTGRPAVEKCLPRTDVPSITGLVPCGSALSSGNRQAPPPTR